jgi:hypothetical protein
MNELGWTRVLARNTKWHVPMMGSGEVDGEKVSGALLNLEDPQIAVANTDSPRV